MSKYPSEFRPLKTRFTNFIKSLKDSGKVQQEACVEYFDRADALRKRFYDKTTSRAGLLADFEKLSSELHRYLQTVSSYPDYTSLLLELSDWLQDKIDVIKLNIRV